MDQTALNYILLTGVGIIAFIAALQLIDSTNNTNTNTYTNTANHNDHFLPVIQDTCNKRTLGIRNAGLAPGTIYDGMPVHRVGPVINFHQRFKHYLPEMGWRSLFLNNYSNYEVVPDTNFNGTMVRNYLDNLENVDNIYRKC
jgi:hypothetical protein